MGVAEERVRAEHGQDLAKGQHRSDATVTGIGPSDERSTKFKADICEPLCLEGFQTVL